MAFFILVTIVLVLAAVAMRTKPTRVPTQQFAAHSAPAFSPQLGPQLSLRQQQLAEESDAIAGEYSARADEAWRAELRARASMMLGDQAKSPTTKTIAK